MSKPKIVEPKLSKNALEVAQKRYLRTDMRGKTVETVGEMLWRVAYHMAKPEVQWASNGIVMEVATKFYERMVEMKMVCAGKAMFEAGNPGGTGQLSSCFVLPIEDSIQTIFKTLGDAAVVHKNNGGTGFNFSPVRPHGDKVKNVPGAASGPVDFLKAYSAALAQILQGAKRQGANIGILNVDHPDIEEFIELKSQDGTIKNFNVSVGVTDEFMRAVAEDKYWNLVNPRNHEVVRRVKAKTLFNKIAEAAWKTGDPGLMFLDTTERSNTVLGVRFLDNMIEVNNYPIPELEATVKNGNRRIGLGVMGFAHLLFKMGISYASNEAVKLAKELSKFIYETAAEASAELAEVRGNFPNWDLSIYPAKGQPMRNCAVTMVAPTGTISILADTSSGIEPVFSLVTIRRTFYEDDKTNHSTKELMIVDSVFEEYLGKRKEVIKQVARGDFAGLTMEEKKIFVTTHEIAPEWHVKIQAAWQKYFDNSISKTVNFPKQATVEEVKKAYWQAWKAGCKGITIYRDGSKDDQVLSTNAGDQINTEICPECGGKLNKQDGCSKCVDCGYSVCG
ncbi:MAG: Ribonucleoside-diphosphate reductase [Microgenomates group bacterium GW2011_GWC1_46_16]|nr:MAG: Ribonucleoside-diphosphate reductase [Microgenomates group bacterium GW2011_GWC1_46_16]